jgi:hypothetical protein
MPLTNARVAGVEIYDVVGTFVADTDNLYYSIGQKRMFGASLGRRPSEQGKASADFACW